MRAWSWMRQNLFATPVSCLATLVLASLIFWIAQGAIQWLFIDAVWSGDGETCRTFSQGACWPYVQNRFRILLYGSYPHDELWRVTVVILSFFVLLGAFFFPLRISTKLGLVVFFYIPYPILCWFLMRGGIFGLSEVPTINWGGFSITLIVSVLGITMSMPLGIVLALGRRSDMPLISSVSIVFIEFWRGIPLITVLFVAAYILGLFFPRGFTMDLLLRALIAVTVFTTAYTAEVIRGGLQAIPKGQFEAAKSLGIPYWKMMGLIILPQALKISVPALAGSFIALFKDTTLLLIISVFDFLAMVQSGTHDPTWSAPTTAYTGYSFSAIVFWIFCFSMSLFSRRLEKKLAVGHRTS